MPEMFGTHHSKMMILFRHDDNIQVIVHTANMIAKDWTNMTNGVWRSPLLPLLPPPPPPPGDAAVADNNPGSTFPLGSGERFKIDLMRYLSCYNKIGPMCKPLIDHIDAFDFSSIRGAFIASTPGRHSITDKSAIWGWNALQKCLKVVDCCSEDKSHIAVQISSIATLGAKDDWLQNTLFKSLSTSKNHNTTRPSFKVVFPTADEIRQSLDGYRSGASIHTKTQSQQQSKQLEYLKPIFHHWANDSVSGLGEQLTYPSNICLFSTNCFCRCVACSRIDQRRAGPGRTPYQNLCSIYTREYSAVGITNIGKSFQTSMGRGNWFHWANASSILGDGSFGLARVIWP